MCGISGLINQKGFSSKELVEMTHIVRHRGPDDEGYALWKNIDDEPAIFGGEDTPQDVFQSERDYLPQIRLLKSDAVNCCLAFGHRRLSIIDLSPNGHQPMSYLGNRYWIVLNGEIYNYIEIKEELHAKGYKFQSNTDTEVVMAAYHEWGVSCQQKFNGMWAFVIYDSKEKTIFISRDRFGIKPLYYWISPNCTFHFASEIKQFTVCEGWAASLNADMAYDYLLYSITDHTEETMFKGVFQILPGHYFFENINKMPASSGTSIDQKKWYQLPNETFVGDFSSAKMQFLQHFHSAIELHLRADVPVGSALSGGLDSSAIVSYVNLLLKKDDNSHLQKTFSSCSLDKRFDEKEWMDEVVKHTGVEGHFLYPRGEDVFSLTEEIVWHMDEPYQSQSAFLGYHVFKEAGNKGVVVLLNGQGADECLSCYGDYELLRLRKKMRKARFLQLYQELPGKTFGSKFRFLLYLIYPELPLRLRMILSSCANRNKPFTQILEKSFINSLTGTHPYLRNNYHKKNTKEISGYQLLIDPLQRYLHWEDRMSMAHSVEARVPFLDYRLVEFTRSLPLEYLIGNNEPKKILVHALEGILPEIIRQRKDKKGFITPEQRWFMEDHVSEFQELFDANIGFCKGIINEKEARLYIKKMQRGEIPFDYSYWRIILFCIWMKKFNVT